MKTLYDKTEVPERTWYYLLDWNDRDGWKFMREEFDEIKLHKLNRVEYKRLLNHATLQDINSL